VVWNGSHHGRNADLLLTPVIEARLPAATDPELVLLALSEGPATCAQIAKRIGWARGRRCTTAICTLLRQRKVTVVGVLETGRRIFARV
jgi:hypothetical protein